MIPLPTASLDSLSLTSGAGLFLINLDPGDGETQVPIESSVAFEVASTTGSPVDSTTLNVVIAGAQAIVAGAFQPGFQGPASALSNPDPDTLRVVIDPETDFVTLSVITVEVDADDIAASAQINDSYSFTIEDLVPPTLILAAAVDLFTVRATYNEPMTQGTGLTGDAALPSAYSLEAIDAPAVTPLPVSATSVLSTDVDVTFPIELSLGRRYRLIAADVDDVFGNRLAEGAAEFVAKDCPDPVSRDFDLLSMLPLVARARDVSGEQAKAIGIFQEVTDLLLCDIDMFHGAVVDPETARERFVDAMLCDLGNPFSFESLSVIDKRRLATLLIEIYKSKGTAQGIVDAIRFFVGVEVEIDIFNVGDGWILGVSELGVDTFLGTDDLFLLYSFQIISPVILDDEQRARVKRIAEYMNGAHEHCIRIVEPQTDPIDHWEIGLSRLGENTLLH